jgi:hypothetical protein
VITMLNGGISSDDLGMPRTHMRIVRMHMGAYMGRTMAPHRAGPDALRLMQAYCYELGRKPAVVAAELIRFLV